MQLGGAQRSGRRDTAQHGDALPVGRWDAGAQPGEKGLTETGVSGEGGGCGAKRAACSLAWWGTGAEMLFRMVHGQLAPSTGGMCCCASLI